MSMEENLKGCLDLLESPMWEYLSKAATTNFSPEDKKAYWIAHKKWEENYLEARWHRGDEKLGEAASL